MDATITAAWIGGGAVILSGGWTALVAVTSARNARRTNQATLDAAAKNTARALDAAREDRIWDKRADAYVEALYVTRNRQERRGDMTRTIRLDKASEESRQQWLASFKLPDEVGMEMRSHRPALSPMFLPSRLPACKNYGKSLEPTDGDISDPLTFLLTDQGSFEANNSNMRSALSPVAALAAPGRGPAPGGSASRRITATRARRQPGKRRRSAPTGKR